MAQSSCCSSIRTYVQISKFYTEALTANLSECNLLDDGILKEVNIYTYIYIIYINAAFKKFEEDNGHLGVENRLN